MLSPDPRPPSNLNPLARELLESLRGQPAARHIILGGGVALSHYHEFRETWDVDAWWPKGIDSNSIAETAELISARMRALGEKYGFDFGERTWGDTRSFELRRGSKKMFSCQISFRDIQLEAPRPAEWTPMLIETFRENLAAKMRALVVRGAPRDFADVAALCRAGLVTPDECWALWREKTPDGKISEGRMAALRLLELIATRRPLENIADPEQRRRAEDVRRFIREEFCAMRDVSP